MDARIAELLLPHQRRRLDQSRVDVAVIDRQDRFGRLQRRIELAAAHLQLRQRKPRQNVIRPYFDGLLELLPRLFAFASRAHAPGPGCSRDTGLSGVARHHRLQLGQRLGDVALIQQEGGRQAARVVIVRRIFENLRIDFGRVAPLALPHQYFDHALLVRRLLLRVFGNAFLVLADRRVAVAHPQVEIAHRQVGLVELLGMRS